ncbi:MAG: leucine--tRNA ligase [bacterium]|nr:leucine--tRNA ligase [bacterium]
MKVLNFQEIEKKWQKYWEENQVYKATFDKTKPKYYVLEMFPYPSGQLHMGHARNYCIGDAIARYYFLKGYNVLHPIGWDAFGLPAENAAIKHKIHPKTWTENNIENMKRQLKQLGISYDWTREINTSRPEYYKFTQWMFLKLYEHDMVYRKKGLVNWCFSCNTVLANEQVIDGKCWRCHNLVGKKELEQWYVRITKYADSLLKELDNLAGWSEYVKQMQRNWIGKSIGAKIIFKVPDLDESLEVFTTRADTLPGVTFVCVAPEHPIVQKIIQKSKNPELESYLRRSMSLTTTERTREKNGVFTGIYVQNPLNGRYVPLWVANYVLMDYATGAVMGVPAHDQRDYEFAKVYNLPIVPVIMPEYEVQDKAYEESKGKMFNVGIIDGVNVDGMDCNEFRKFVIKYLESKNLAKEEISYKLKDWLISRQRYWGAPIPIIYCDSCGIVPVPYEDLPVMLPENIEITGFGESPLAYCQEFVNTKCPKCANNARRETDTMDTFVCSSWYFWRYTSPYEKDKPFNPEELKYWMPVDQYIGGIEHAVMHLLYSRFLSHFLYDLGIVPTKEPFQNLLNQGMVCKDGKAMSKSLGNIVSIEEITEKYGADTGRVFELFVAPPGKDIEWSDKGIEGVHRFLNRYFKYCSELINYPIQDTERTEETREKIKSIFNKVYKTLYKITEEFETKRYHFNTSIASLMELLNFLEDEKDSTKYLNTEEKNTLIDILVKMISPFAPHIAEEIWSMFGKKDSIFKDRWPEIKHEYLIEEKVTIPVQVNGRVKGQIEVSVDSELEKIMEAVKNEPKIYKHIQNRTIKNTIFVKNKIVNIIVE